MTGQRLRVGPATLDHLVAEATKGIDFLAGKVEVVMNDEDSSHVTPPAWDRAYRSTVGVHERCDRVANVTIWRAKRPS